MLGDVRVLDLTRLLPGNYCTLLLADLGADVVKVEEPGRGDYIRWMPPLVDGEGAIHRALNRGKRSITLNLKSEEGVTLLLRLAAEADLLVESFRPGVLERLGAGPEALLEANPRLVVGSITGYGQDGPYRDRAGHDINYAGIAGLLHATGAPDGPPVLPSVQVGDLGGAMAAAVGLLAALHEATRIGRGRHVDVAMLDVAFSWQPVLLAHALTTGQAPPRGGMPLSGGLACYRVYGTADGKHLAVGALEPQFWRALCEALEVPDLIDLQFGPDQEEVARRLQAVFATRTRDEWVGSLAGLDACVGPVNDALEAMADAQLRHRGMLAEVGGTVVGPGPAVRSVGAVPALSPAPALGAHTEEVLAGLGIGAEELAGLRERGAV